MRVLATAPDSGEEIKGTGGVRKLRFGAKRQAKGKSGGVRVIYYFYNLTFPVAALRIYSKSEKSDLTPRDVADVTREAAELKALAVARQSRKGKKKMSAVGKEVSASLREVADYLRSGRKPAGMKVHVIDVPAVDVAALRQRLKMSQATFSRTFGLDVRSVQQWEQGKRSPDRAARTLLRVIDRDPEAVKSALAEA